LVQDQGGGEIETGGILQYSEDFNFTANEDIGAKDFFEIACRKVLQKFAYVPKKNYNNKSYSQNPARRLNR
jgi:hypothetical protein